MNQTRWKIHSSERILLRAESWNAYYFYRNSILSNTTYNIKFTFQKIYIVFYAVWKIYLCRLTRKHEYKSEGENRNNHKCRSESLERFSRSNQIRNVIRNCRTTQKVSDKFYFRKNGCFRWLPVSLADILRTHCRRRTNIFAPKLNYKLPYVFFFSNGWSID